MCEAYSQAPAPANPLSRKLNPNASLRSTLRNAPLDPPGKLQVAAALAGFKNQRGLVAPLKLKSEVSLSRAIRSQDNNGKGIRQRAAELLGLEVEDFWWPDWAA